MPNGPSLIAINVGNTRTQIGQFVDGELTRTEQLDDSDITSIIAKVVTAWKEISDSTGAAIVLASVNDPVAEGISAGLQDQIRVTVYRLGEDLPIPIGRQLDPETITGVDRLLNAAAAYDALNQACIVVDAGTAVTVDFIDGDGTFHGGAIAPGASMQLRSLHEGTAALPELRFIEPDHEAFGRSTSQAMLQGVFHGIRGLVWKLVERYAEEYGAYPTVIATGGDAEVLFKDDELIDRIVPQLSLMGIAAAARLALANDEDARRS